LPKDDFYKPTDIDALRMENELLTFEVRFLKTQLTEAEQLRSRLAEAEQLGSRLAEAEQEAEQLGSRLAEAEQEAQQLRSRLAKAERAEQDLVLLLRRLANSPLGWFFRRKKGFRVLEQRYLGPDAGDVPTKLGCEEDKEW
jgi:DNA repair exonuclease SbcCD ATPase subunit